MVLISFATSSLEGSDSYTQLGSGGRPRYEFLLRRRRLRRNWFGPETASVGSCKTRPVCYF